jgi:hypothetical protein
MSSIASDDLIAASPKNLFGLDTIFAASVALALQPELLMRVSRWISK